jgi:uncharacterized repeat protein (TIGR01451 family)
VGTAVKFDISPPLRSITPILTVSPRPEDDDRGTQGPVNDTRHELDPVVQRSAGSGVFGPDVTPPTDANFEGISNPNACGGCAPPDPNGDIGPNHYVQMVNLKFQVFSRTGTPLFGPANTNTLWVGFGGPCEIENAGDPIVLHDQLADRWLLTQFTATGPAFFNCVAISTSSDPTGSYYRYAFSTGPNFPDYPKYGVWPDAYYISTREFAGGAGPFVGVGAYALNRAQMLVGNPLAQVVSFLVPPAPDAYRVGDGLLPSDLDGSNPPPPGSPNYFVGSMDSGGPYSAPADALNLFKFHVDFATPTNSTFTFTNQIPTAAFDSVFPCSPARACIPQPGTPTKVDILSYRQRPLHRLAYRNFGTHESLVTNQSVEATAGIAGVRWWEIRSPNSGPTIFQEGTYAPGDGVHRWMGSAAMDASGDIALGYSVSDAATVFPGIRYTGRLVTDPAGTMPQGEAVLVNGTGSQTGGGNRWGDYSSMNVDPVDDCTFWYTNEYYGATSAADWQTRVGSFTFPECTPGPPIANVGVTKVPDAVNTAVGSPIGFTVTLSNIGGLTATGLSLSDNLPAGDGINWSIDGANTDAGWSVNGSPPNESLVYTPTSLAANTSTHAHVVSNTTAASCGPYANTASYTTGNDGSGQASATATVGFPNVVFTQNFDGVTAPALPVGWTATNVVPPTGAPLWATSNSGNPAPAADTAPNAAYVDNPGAPSDKRLDSPSIAIQSANAKLTFRHNYNFESGWDGGVLEISIGGGVFVDIVTAGGSFVTGAYSGTLDPTGAGNALAGRNAWTGNSAGFVTTTVNLPAAAAGLSIQLRWRSGSDNTIGGQGWRVDSISLADGLDCDVPTAVAVAWVTARPVAKGVLLRWRTSSAANLLGFEVWRQTSSGRQRLNKKLVVARRSAQTYSYLAKRSLSSGAYWVRAVARDGSGRWYGPAKTRRR